MHERHRQGPGRNFITGIEKYFKHEKRINFKSIEIDGIFFSPFDGAAERENKWIENDDDITNRRCVNRTHGAKWGKRGDGDECADEITRFICMHKFNDDRHLKLDGLCEATTVIREI